LVAGGLTNKDKSPLGEKEPRHGGGKDRRLGGEEEDPRHG